MLPDKPWQPEAVLRLAAGVVFCLVVGMWLVMGLGRLWPGWAKADKDFVSFMAGALCFQAAALGLVHFFLREHRVGWRDGFGLGNGSLRRVAGLAGLAILVVMPATFLLGNAAELLLSGLGIKWQLQDAVKMVQNQPRAGYLAGYGATAVLLAPFAEEVLFRGILYPTLKQSGYPRLALWVSSVLFASTHMNLLAFVPLTFLALVLTWLYEKTGNLLAPILAHVLFNAVNFALLVIAPSWLKTH